MVELRVKNNKYGRYVYVYYRNKFLQYIGREDKISPEKRLFIKHKWEEKIKNEKDK